MLDTFKKYLGLVIGTLLVIAAAFGVTQFTQPDPFWTVVINAVAALLLAIYNRQQPQI